MSLPPTPIAIVLSSFDAGGTERQMVELIRRLPPSRWRVHVACFRREGVWLPRVESSSAAEVTAFPLRGFLHATTPVQLVRFARWCRHRGIALVQACDFYANVFALPGAALARVPVRIGSRRDLVLPGRSVHHHRIQRLAYRAATRLVANSQAAAAQLAAEGVPPARVRVIPNGVESPVGGHRRRRDGGRRIVCVANLRPGKGHDTLLAAMVTLARHCPDATLRCVGDGPERGAIEEAARAHGISDRVEMTGRRDDVRALLAESDVFVLPSVSEASPNSVLEAMASGLPVVATDVGGIPELVTHGVTGLLVPPRAPDALAGALRLLLDDPSYADRLGQAARDGVRRTASFDLMVERFEHLYLDSLGVQLSSEIRTAAPAEV